MTFSVRHSTANFLLLTAVLTSTSVICVGNSVYCPMEPSVSVLSEVLATCTPNRRLLALSQNPCTVCESFRVSLIVLESPLSGLDRNRCLASDTASIHSAHVVLLQHLRVKRGQHARQK